MNQTINMDKVHVIVDKIIKTQARKNIFAEYTEKDIAQEIWAIVMNSLEKYDPARANLENFLAVCVKNRLRNLYRNQYHRREPPCPSCPYYDKDVKKCTIFTEENKNECDKWDTFQKNIWRRINVRRPKFMSELSTQNVVEFSDNSVDQEIKIDVYDTIREIDGRLGSEIAVCLLHCISGNPVSIPHKCKKQLQDLFVELDLI